MKYDPYLGRIIANKFRIIDFIGQGGMGAVYLAEHETLPRRFAIKILKSEYLENENFVERFRREAIAASRIVHPNIVYITDFGRLEEGNFYIVMEYLEGQGLDSILEIHGKIPLSRALPILVQVADALDHAHAMGVVHRDLKAENVLLTRERGKKDVVKLLDFGIARMLLPSFSRTRITLHGQVFGTPEYMSPEQASDSPIDGRSDIYAVGILAYELLTGNPPFYHDDPTEILHSHLYDTPLAPSTKMPEQPIPKLLDGLILRCLAKDPDERFQTGAKLKSELLRVRNMLTRMASDLVIQKAAGETSPADAKMPEELEVLEESSVSVAGRSILDLRDDLHGTIKELLFAFIGDSVIDTENSHFLDELISLESESAGLTSNITYKEQEFESIREQYGVQEANLRYAHLDLQQEYASFVSSHQEPTEAQQQYIRDLEFQVNTIKARLEQISKQKRDAIVSLNKDLTGFRKVVEERELEISHHYAQMQGIIDATRKERHDQLTLKYGVLLGKYDHLKEILETVRRKAGSMEQPYG